MNILERHAKLVVVLSSIAVSSSSVFIRMAEDMPSLALGFFRLSCSMPFVLFPVLLRHREELCELNRKQLAGSALAGFFLFLQFFSWFVAIPRTTVASAVVLSCLHPIIVLIFSYLMFREKSNIKVIIGVVIAILGGAIITGGDYNFTRDALLGDLMALLAAFFMAFYFITGRKLRKGISTPVYIFIVFGSCWASFLAGMLVTGTSFSGYSIKSHLAALALAIVCQVIGHGVFNWCLGYVSSLYLSTVETSEVVFASIIALIFLNEVPTFWQIVGGLITISGILIYNYFEEEQNN